MFIIHNNDLLHIEGPLYYGVLHDDEEPTIFYICCE